MPLTLPLLTTRRLAVAVLFVLLFAVAVRIPVDTDTWWHLRSGEYILQHGIPTTDPFSLTRLNQPWIDHSWGSQIIMYAVYKLSGGAGQPGDGGNVGLAFYTALLATIGMVFVYLMCEGEVYARMFVIVIAAAAAAVFWSARPQMISFALSTVVLYVLYLYKRKHVDRLWLLPVIMLLWVNLHSGWAIGFIFLFGTIGGEVIGRVWSYIVKPATPDDVSQILTWRQIGRLAIFTFIAAVVLVVNPNTYKMWTYPFVTVGIGVLQQYIQEWLSPNFHGRETWPFIMLLLGTFAAAGLSSRRIDWTDLILTAGTTFMALLAGRNIAVFAVVAAPVCCRHLASLLEERNLRLRPSRPPKRTALMLNWAILVLVVFAAVFKIVFALNPAGVAAAQVEYLPVKAATYLRDNPQPAKMFNSYNWGGYLMFAAPQYLVFVDGRTDLYDDEVLSTWLKTIQGDDWQKTFEKYGINLAVIEHDSGLAKLLRLDQNWKEVYSDQQASIFRQLGPSS